MVKSFLFFLLFAAVAPVRAQGLPDTYDPLEEKAKVAGAYVPNFRELMRDIVFAFGDFAKARDPSFKILIQGGESLLRRGTWENDLDDLHAAEAAGIVNEDERYLLKLFSPEHPIPVNAPNRRFINAVKGLFMTNLYCGGGRGKPNDITRKIVSEYGLSVISVEHCADEKERQDALVALARKKIPVFADTEKFPSFDKIDTEKRPFAEHHGNVETLDAVRNVLVLTNTRGFKDKDTMLSEIAKTNYDLVVIDPFFRKDEPLTAQDVKELQTKKVGAKRLVFAVLNVSTAEDTRKYWQKGWKIGSPRWLRFQSKENPAGVTTDYWNSEWKKILGVWFRSIMDQGFDGVILQGLDAHKIYERIITIN